MIVAGTAKDSNKNKAKGTRKECAVSSHPEALTDEDYADCIARYADIQLEPVKGQDRKRFRIICQMLQESFEQAAKGLNNEHG
jgi:hypothetical protein